MLLKHKPKKTNFSITREDARRREIRFFLTTLAEGAGQEFDIGEWEQETDLLPVLNTILCPDTWYYYEAANQWGIWCLGEEFSDVKLFLEEYAGCIGLCLRTTHLADGEEVKTMELGCGRGFPLTTFGQLMDLAAPLFTGGFFYDELKREIRCGDLSITTARSEIKAMIEFIDPVKWSHFGIDPDSLFTVHRLFHFPTDTLYFVRSAQQMVVEPYARVSKSGWVLDGTEFAWSGVVKWPSIKLLEKDYNGRPGKEVALRVY